MHGLGSGFDLVAQRGDRDGGEPARQLAPECGITVHERLHGGERPRRASLDQVAGDGERRAGEADEGGARSSEFPADQPGRFGDVRRVGGGFEGAQPGQIGFTAEGLGHHGAASLFDLDAESDRVHRHHDVGEEDGGVDAVAPHRLEGQLGGQRRVCDR